NSEPLYYLLRLLLPTYFGNNLWYVGIVPLALAAAAVVLRPRGIVWFWVGMAVFALLVTYGIGPFLYVRWLPLLSATVPSRIGYLFIASVAVLSGFGYDACISRAGER